MIKEIKQSKTNSSKKAIPSSSPSSHKVISLKKYEVRKLAKYSKSLIRETNKRLQD